jgi:AcrR family transcriptional regulator
VSPKSISSRGPRAYRSELREQQALATRRRVLDAAAELFSADGYARTTMAKIAASAGVSAETVQGMGPKAALMIAAVEDAAFGVTGDRNILDMDPGRTLLAIDDVDAAVEYLVAVQTDVHERTAKLSLALIAGAGADPVLDRYLTDLIAGVGRQIRRVLDAFRDRGWVRTDVPYDDVVETAVVLASVDTFLRFTHRDGRSVDAYRGWLRRMVRETVCAR